jgi:hypothetical protein
MHVHAGLISTLTEGMRQRIIAKSVPPEKARCSRR